MKSILLHIINIPRLMHYFSQGQIKKKKKTILLKPTELFGNPYMSAEK